MGVEAFPIKPHERVSAITKEHHTRKNMAYICEDRFREHLILSQRLGDIVTAIDSLVSYEPERVSVAGLYHSLGKTENQTSRYAKHRWKVQPIDLDSAAQVFEAVRGQGGDQNHLIVGERGAYQLACV